MAWVDEPELITRGARLCLSPPQAVYDELKRLAGTRELLGNNELEEVEKQLISRNEPLVNLGLAMYGRNHEVIAALYGHSLAPPVDAPEGIYKRGLRVGCLSNSTVPKQHFSLRDFPACIIGEAELNRILSEGDPQELKALLTNPEVDEKLLEEIFSFTGRMEGLSEKRRQEAFYEASCNERINIEVEYTDMPDLDHMRIHRAIFTALETAPVEPRWFWLLHGLLLNIGVTSVHSPTRIDHVLNRWRQLSFSGDHGKKGYYTSLSLPEEFCCLIASIYTHGYVNNTGVEFGSAASEDVALRCAYYAGARLDDKEMARAYERDKEVFVFAACHNSFRWRKDRQLFEDEYLTDDLALIFKRRHGETPKRQSDNSEALKQEAEAKAIHDRLAKIEKSIQYIKPVSNTSLSAFTLLIGMAFAFAIGHWLR